MTVTTSTPRRPRWWWELLVLVWLLWAYDAISNLAHLRRFAAIDNAGDAWHLERILHLDPERPLNHWLAGHQTFGLWVSDYYDNAHFIVTLAVIGWLWWRHHDAYRPLRTMLVLVNVIGFVVFWLYPMAPPRLLPGSRIIDVVAATHAIGSWHSGTLATVGNANELASMPSLHIAWALWCSWALWQVLPHRRFTSLVFVYPLLTAYAVLATGNHYLVDVVAGALTLVLAVVMVNHLPDVTVLRGRRALRGRSGDVGAGRDTANVGSSG
jgi:diacylglycerol O-acyltransferase